MRTRGCSHRRLLLVRGGSIASGVGVGKGYTDHLEALCRAKGVEFVNVSRPGETSFDGVWTFDEDIAPWRPDILVIHFGIDDAFHPVYRSEFKENLVRMVGSARSHGDPVIVMPTSHTFEDVHEMDAVDIYYRTIREVCMDLGCTMVAVHTIWAGSCRERGITTRDLVLSDARLPNEDGHLVIAEAMRPAIERAIERVKAAGAQKRCPRDQGEG
ncbi:MAG TPA: SGNH/GDSL hydrolase family protein [Deltaproteobacteria bacterium]|nr:SGNH/GDSL hydrolase family protein [Deltaproteobacteria bacterium]